jgi:hypothetical protein
MIDSSEIIDDLHNYFGDPEVLKGINRPEEPTIGRIIVGDVDRRTNLNKMRSLNIINHFLSC